MVALARPVDLPQDHPRCVPCSRSEIVIFLWKKLFPVICSRMFLTGTPDGIRD